MRPLDKIDLALKAQIAKRIKALREKTGESISDFARKTDRDRQSQHRWENEGASILIINKFCIEIGITLKEFFDDPIFK